MEDIIAKETLIEVFESSNVRVENDFISKAESKLCEHHQPGKKCLPDSPEPLVVGRMVFELSSQPSRSL